MKCLLLTLVLCVVLSEGAYCCNGLYRYCINADTSIKKQSNRIHIEDSKYVAVGPPSLNKAKPQAMSTGAASWDLLTKGNKRYLIKDATTQSTHLSHFQLNGRDSALIKNSGLPLLQKNMAQVVDSLRGNTKKIKIETGAHVGVGGNHQ